ncbi:cell division protein FtsN [Escherichia coli]
MLSSRVRLNKAGSSRRVRRKPRRYRRNRASLTGFYSAAVPAIRCKPLRTRPPVEAAASCAGCPCCSTRQTDGGEKDERRWMVQCGSFRGAEQAETVRAQLAFEGFDSKITTNNGWNRVVIGPVKGKENVDSTLNRLKMAGHTNCIRLAAGVETLKIPPSIIALCPVLLYGVCTLYS